MSILLRSSLIPITDVSPSNICSRTRTMFNNPNIFKSVLHIPNNYVKTTTWKQSRWPGKRNLVNAVENKYKDNFALSRLWKPFIFTITVSGVSVGAAAIWQYENVRHQATLSKGIWGFSHKHEKYGQFRQHIHKIWNNLSAGDKIFAPICALNILVFLAWRVPRWQPIMNRFFASGLDTNALCWPMLLSVFSHYSALHLAANMFVLHSFSDKAVQALGREQFLGMYLSGGMLSSFTSYLYKALTRCPNSSLGASGAVMCVLSYFCLRYPDSRLAVIFLPQFPFEASTGLKALICFDTVGCILRWGFFDHAAHLGGTLFGLFWFYLGHEYIWRKREPLISTWHKIRGPV